MLLFTWSVMHLKGQKIIKIICNQSPTTEAQRSFFTSFTAFHSFFLLPPLHYHPPPLAPAILFPVTLTGEFVMLIINSFTSFPPWCHCGQPISVLCFVNCSPELTVTLSWPAKHTVGSFNSYTPRAPAGWVLTLNRTLQYLNHFQTHFSTNAMSVCAVMVQFVPKMLDDGENNNHKNTWL